MIPAENKLDIIQSGMNFMRSITEAYGVDEGMKLWDTIATTLDPDVKGQIFFAMLTGEYNNIITIASHSPNANRVAMIKAIRTVDRRGPGLKEAKDMSDIVSSGKTIKIEVEPTNRNKALVELRSAGFHV
jgi:ribosomal protein L7/L12